VIVKDGSEYTLQVATVRGRKVATLKSVLGAVLTLADDYEREGEPEVAYAFRLFADSLTDAAPPAVSAVTQHGPHE
jgi:hypothetical protein